MNDPDLGKFYRLCSDTWEGSVTVIETLKQYEGEKDGVEGSKGRDVGIRGRWRLGEVRVFQEVMYSGKMRHTSRRKRTSQVELPEDPGAEWTEQMSRSMTPATAPEQSMRLARWRRPFGTLFLFLAGCGSLQPRASWASDGGP